MTAFQYDVIVIGGGIVGLATALRLLSEKPELKVAVLEKESQFAQHQTGHNSGVIHTGIYYRPGSLKAQNCVAGVKALLAFCQEEDIPYELCGKVIVATSSEELPRLEELYRRGQANGVAGLEMIGPERLKEIEPHVAGIRALYSPNTGIIDFGAVAQAYADKIQKLGGALCPSHCVLGIEKRQDATSIVTTNQGDFEGRFLINCAGLHADRVARMVDEVDETATTDRILPFRGEYYFVSDSAFHLVKGLIYPVPDPAFPFLGVHLTKTIDGRVEAGPNAVLAWAREGYRKTDINVRDLMESLGYPGLWRMGAKYWKTGLYEMYRSYSKNAFLHALQRFVPELSAKDLVTGGSGVRAQLVSRAGNVIDDFAIVESEAMIHVLSAPSPAATASLAVGEQLALRCLSQHSVG